MAIFVPWISATMGYTLNSDGSSMQNATISTEGGILRNSRGKMILAYSFFFGQGTNMCSESLALLVGLFLCEKIQVSNITVRCDSQILADMLNGKASIPWKISPVLKKITRYKGSVAGIKHCYREANSVADALAKEAYSHRSHRVYITEFQVPPNIWALISLDRTNVCNLRFSRIIS